MKRRSVYVLIATILAILVPSPGRFVYGITLVLELNLLMLVGTLANSLVRKIKLEEMNTLIVLILIISTTILYRQIMIMLQPEVMLTLGFIIYLMPVSVFLFGYLFSNQGQPLKERLKLNMFHVLTYSIYALLFFLLRDLAGYGTITFYGANHQIYEKVLISAQKTGFFSIFASIPGALILSSILLFIHIYVRNRFDIVRKAEVNK
ncbi:MAG: hypothetical protein IKR64_07555 [Treponema sp.]|nr:hypothetical protein [Treponema sp.]